MFIYDGSKKDMNYDIVLFVDDDLYVDHGDLKQELNIYPKVGSCLTTLRIKTEV